MYIEIVKPVFIANRDRPFRPTDTSHSVRKKACAARIFES